MVVLVVGMSLCDVYYCLVVIMLSQSAYTAENMTNQQIFQRAFAVYARGVILRFRSNTVNNR